jgi:hypothetical protein
MKHLVSVVLLAIGCGSGAGTGDSTTTAAALPVAADNLFAASGYMGDGANPGVITDSQACPQRAGAHEGKCHKFTWNPAGGALGWAGVYWQFPANNWGTQTGQILPAGAKSISFYAWGSKGGETVAFFAGLQPYDGFYVASNAIALTTTPTQYTLNLSKVSYGKVIGGFGWSDNVHGADPVVFYIDDVEWTAEAPVTAVPGCIDSKASNYNAGATSDDGSCTYLVTFQLDLTGSNVPPTSKVQVRSSFNGFCDDCNPLSLQTGQTWTSALPLKPGTYQYKYATDSTQAGYEVIPTACAANPAASDAERNRSLTVTAAAQTLPLVKFGACP